MNGITMELVVKCLKYIAEHRGASYEEISEGLIELGWIYDRDYLERNVPFMNMALGEGIKNMDLYTGANIVMNAVSKPLNWAFVQQKLLSVDDDISVYNFIRVATGDPTYTKESIDQSKSNSK